MDSLTAPGATLAAIRQRRPLVHNITNLVAQDLVANLLLAVGAAPVMASAAEEVEEVVAGAAALTVNTGTFSPALAESVLRAAAAAGGLGKPWVLDPVGVAMTGLRRRTCAQLVALRPSLIRGNASEILALAERQPSPGHGIESHDDAETAADAAQALAAQSHGVVAVTGRVDLVTDGTRLVSVANGDADLRRITALGCALSALSGAALAVEPDPLVATVHALAILGVAGERAAQRARGPGSLRVELLDGLARLAPRELDVAAKIAVRKR
jgi:hydroxyethylthiazole kinase